MSISMTRRDLLKYGTTMGTGLLFHHCARGNRLKRSRKRTPIKPSAIWRLNSTSIGATMNSPEQRLCGFMEVH